MVTTRVKKWYYSKTVWVNVLATLAMIAQVATGKDVLNPEIQAMIITVLNLVLRALTKHELK